MPISIDSWRRLNGAGCEHIEITATVHGRSVTLRSSLSEIRGLVEDEREVRQALLVVAGLRRKENRLIEGVVL